MNMEAYMTDLTKYKEIVAALEEVSGFFKGHNALNHLPEWVWRQEKSGLDFDKYQSVIMAARAEISEFEKRQNALDTSGYETIISEDYILINSALRMDGYKYRDETDLDTKVMAKSFIETGNFDAFTPLDKLAFFFLLQRWLCKWGGEYLPHNAYDWKMYRQLFLDTAEVEVPREFMPEEDSWWSKWKYRIKPRLDECVAIVSEIHRNTEYEDPDSNDD